MQEHLSDVPPRAEAARYAARRHGWAWLALCAALAAHVTDEALTDFLSVYNPTVRAIRQTLPFLPLPIFTFKVWLTALIVAVTLLVCLSPFAFRRARWMAPLSYAFGVLMLANGLGHFLGSIYLRRWMPGVYSSPLLLVFSVYLLISVRKTRQAGSRVPR